MREMARNSSTDVGEVPVSANRRSGKAPFPSDPVYSSRRDHSAGMALNRSTRWSLRAPLNVSASVRSTNTTPARACHCWRAIVQPAMWNRGYGHSAAPRGSSCEPGWERSTLVRCDSTAAFGRPVLPLVKKATCGSISVHLRKLHCSLSDSSDRVGHDHDVAFDRVGRGSVRPIDQRDRGSDRRGDRSDRRGVDSRIQRSEHDTGPGTTDEQRQQVERRVGQDQGDGTGRET